MKPLLSFGLGLLVCLCAGAQSTPALVVDAAANSHPISPYIYGINEWSDNGLLGMMRVPLLRWGGDDATSFNWQNSVKNNTGDNPWCFENYSVSPGFDGFQKANLAAGTVSMATVSLMDWLPKSGGECSFSVKKYGAQKATNPDNSDCGNGVLLNGNQIQNDPNDAYIPVTPAFSQQWLSQLLSSYGPGNTGGVRIWEMDNEPEWWYSVHIDVYPQAATYDDMMARNLKWAQAVKAIDPTALVSGPVPAGWSGMLFSRLDFDDGWSKSPYQYWDNPLDYQAHGSTYWIPYYLQQMQKFEQQNGYRLLDIVDVHGYITPSGLSGSAGDATMETLRMTSTRALWDPNYLVPGGGYEDATGAEVAPELVPRMRQWVSDNYPGTKTAITEYNWGAPDTITGAVAQADILGIFGREQLDYGTVWTTLSPTSPAAFAFKMYLNYDGNGSHFGDTSVSATSDNPDQLSIFAAKRYDSVLTIAVLNKTSSAITDSIALANFTPAGTAQVWQYSGANLSAIVRQPDIGANSSGLSTTFPAQSITLLAIPQAQSAMAVPQPAISAVTNGASYDAKAVSPGGIVAVWGTGLGPSAGAYLTLDSNSLVETSIGGTQVLINGNPAPLIYAGAGQVNAVVPYEVASSTTANVVVVYQGNASAPFPMPVAATRPGIFTHSGSGTGQGAILNQDQTVNTATNPAARGSWISIYATGEGITTPPGVDGRVSAYQGAPLPKAQAGCSATIGGQTANINYCGEAPDFIAGVLQMNVQVPDSITPGSSVPLTITVGGITSQANVTLAVQ
ncbi:MAG TPA: glycoside hydrolase family 44 protein [Bryobacteraceae bacterium]|nr:glycoside hydrolase family 44 protein [Bryobacteraceae bacterium]